MIAQVVSRCPVTRLCRIILSEGHTRLPDFYKIVLSKVPYAYEVSMSHVLLTENANLPNTEYTNCELQLLCRLSISTTCKLYGPNGHF